MLSRFDREEDGSDGSREVKPGLFQDFQVSQVGQHQDGAQVRVQGLQGGEDWCGCQPMRRVDETSSLWPPRSRSNGNSGGEGGDKGKVSGEGQDEAPNVLGEGDEGGIQKKIF